MDLQTRFSEHDWAYVVDSREEDALPELDLDGLLAESEEELLELEDVLELDGPSPPSPPARRPPARSPEVETHPALWA